MRVLLEGAELDLLDKADGIPVNFRFLAQGKGADGEICVLLEASVRAINLPKYVERVTEQVWDSIKKP